MTLHRRNPRRDSTEADIIAALEAIGVHVSRVSGAGIPDLLCSYRGKFFLVECKSRRGKLTAAQERFMSDTVDCPVFVVRSPDEAVDAAQGVE